MRRLLHAPHRAGFFAGSLLLLASFAWWGLTLWARTQGAVADTALPPTQLHGVLMLYGFFPLFMLGFIYTAGPRWLAVAPPAPRYWAPAIASYAGGTLATLAATRWPGMLSIGLWLQLAGWSGATAIWLGRIRASEAPDRKHAFWMLAAFGLGLVGLASLLGWRADRVADGWSIGITLGLWGFVLPVYLTVSHRMLPFFSASALQSPTRPYRSWRPDALLTALVGLSWGHAALALAGIGTLAADLPFAALLLYTSARWQLLRSFQVKLLAMQHVAFAWAGLALTLYAVQGAAALAGTYVLGTAPLHALTLGFLASMLFAFVTRVSLGHSGRALVAGRVVWTLYWMLQAVTVARVLAELLPRLQTALYLGAVGVATFAFLAWGTHFVPMYLRARADGQPG